MLKLDNLYAILDGYAPFEISDKIIENGGYDNSGVLIRNHDQINKILFSLDLSVDCVKRAKRLGVDTIITHHPAIYNPPKTLDIDSVNTSSIMLAIKYNMNVISMHLNLDMAVKGIDFYLAQALGANGQKILDVMGENVGYGRQFSISQTTFSDFVKMVKSVFGTNKVIAYGGKHIKINNVASFCGAGGSHVEQVIKNGENGIDVVVTSDLAHHQIKALLESGVAVVLLTHYSAENYGFKKFYSSMEKTLTDVDVYYFEDKRFI